MEYILTIFISYMIGTLSMSYFIGKRNGILINQEGSKNLGASNTMVLLGWKAGIIVAVHDILKAFLAVLLCQKLFPHCLYIGEVAGVFCVLGHIFPFYLNFKGGKGLASYIGMSFALDWKFSLGLIVCLILITVITDYIVISTFTTMISLPVYHFFILNNTIGALLMSCLTFIMIFKHKENIIRLLKGQEVGLRSANKGEFRIK